MHRFRLAAIAALLAGSFVLTGTAAAQEQAATPGVSPTALELLQTWWHNGRADNYASGSLEGDLSAINAGYSFIRTEARIQDSQVSGTKPLWLYWHSGRGDNFTTATTAGRNAAIAAGYRFVRTEGYVYSSRVSGTVPLYTYWHSGRGDNFSAATTAGINAAERAGYRRTRTEGYVFPP